MTKGDEHKDNLKDIAVGVTGVALTFAAPPAAAVVGATTLAAVAWNRVRNRNERRAQRLFDDLINGDHALEAEIRERAEHEDEEVITALRLLLTAAIETIEPAAVGPIAVVGRRCLRGEWPIWLGRGLLEVLSRVNATQLGVLRALAAEIAPITSAWIAVVADISEGNGGWYAHPQGNQLETVPLTPFPDAHRLFALLKRAGIATESSDYGTAASPKVVYVDVEAARALRAALDC